MIDLQKIAEKLIADLMVQKDKHETEVVVCQVRAEGVRMYHAAIMEAITHEQKETNVEGSEPSKPQATDEPSEAK